METILHVDVRKTHRSNGQRVFELAVTFSAGRGITVLFGPSGSGKTSLLQAVAGIVRPDAGRIALGEQVFFDAGQGIDLPIQRRRVGMVFQQYLLFPHMTVRANILFAAPRKTQRVLHERMERWLGVLGIGHLLARYPHEISGGEQQRVAIARALMADPQLLLCDEPLSAVDPALRQTLLDEIVEVQRLSALPCLYVTHNLAEAVRVGTHAVVLAHGRLMQQGSPLEVIARPQSLTVASLVGTDNLFSGTVLEHKHVEGVTVVNIEGCTLEVSHQHMPVGAQLTLGIRPEDILLSLMPLHQTSARNVLAGRILEMRRAAEGIEVVVDCGVPFKVSITPAAVTQLGLSPGRQVYLLIKARACQVLG